MLKFLKNRYTRYKSQELVNQCLLQNTSIMGSAGTGKSVIINDILLKAEKSYLFVKYDSLPDVIDRIVNEEMCLIFDKEVLDKSSHTISLGYILRNHQCLKFLTGYSEKEFNDFLFLWNQEEIKEYIPLMQNILVNKVSFNNELLDGFIANETIWQKLYQLFLDGIVVENGHINEPSSKPIIYIKNYYHKSRDSFLLNILYALSKEKKYFISDDLSLEHLEIKKDSRIHIEASQSLNATDFNMIFKMEFGMIFPYTQNNMYLDFLDLDYGNFFIMSKKGHIVSRFFQKHRYYLQKKETNNDYKNFLYDDKKRIINFHDYLNISTPNKEKTKTLKI